MGGTPRKSTGSDEARARLQRLTLSDGGLGFFESGENAEELTHVRHVEQRLHLRIHSGERQLAMSLL